MTTLTTQNRQLIFSQINGVSGIITIQPHRVDDKGIVLDFIIMAVMDRNNDMIYKYATNWSTWIDATTK